MNREDKILEESNLKNKSDRGFHVSPEILYSFGAVALALLINAVIIALQGVSPLKAYQVLWKGAFGSKNAVAETLLRATPLALVGLGACAAFRASVFNVGTEGQIFIGGTVAAVIALALPDLPQVLLIPLMCIAGMAAAALLGSISIFLKLKYNANEMINTIMTNYVVIYLVSWLVHGPIQQPGSPLGQTDKFSKNGILPRLIPRTRLHVGFVVLLILVVITYILLEKTVWGYQIKVTGKNLDASKAAGIRVKRVFYSAMIYSGAMAGLAGVFEASGVQNRMIENLSSGYGYTGIVVALLGQLNTVGVLFAAVLFGALQVGASSMETMLKIPSSAVSMIQYLIVIIFLGKNAFPRLWKRIRGSREEKA